MLTLPSSIRLPRLGVAALIALVGGVAIAVELTVPAPRPAAKLRSVVACPPRLSDDRLIVGCRATITVIEIDRTVDRGFALSPPARVTEDGRTVAPRIRNLGGGVGALSLGR